MWDSISTDGSFGKSRSEEMISREDSPNWRRYTSEQKHRGNDLPKNFEPLAGRLPSWDCLEANLDQKLSKFDRPIEPDSLEVNRDVGIDYLLAANPSREFPQDRNDDGEGRKTRVRRKNQPPKVRDPSKEKSFQPVKKRDAGTGGGKKKEKTQIGINPR